MGSKYKQTHGKRTLAGTWSNYRCRKNSKAATSTPCNNRQVSGAVLEGKVWEEIELPLSDPTAFVKRVEREETKKLDIPILEKKFEELSRTS